MGIFDFFRKKKKTDDTFPENELERSLQNAYDKTGSRNDFFQKLLWADLVVISDGSYDEEMEKNSEDEKVTVRFWAHDSGHIPIFTSHNRIYDGNIMKKELPTLQMKAQDLFSIAKGHKFVLNPYSQIVKELTVEELNSLLDGTLYAANDRIETAEKQAKIFKDKFDKACALQEGIIYLGDIKFKKTNAEDNEKLLQSIALFKECLVFNPDNWRSIFFMAKAHQRLGNHTEALRLMEKTCELETELHFIPMEASLEAMSSGDIEKSLYFSEQSMLRSPDNVEAMGNHAMNLLIANRDQEAKIQIDKALHLKPYDKVNKNVKSIIYGVIDGSKERPTFKDVIY